MSPYRLTIGWLQKTQRTISANPHRTEIVQNKNRPCVRTRVSRDYKEFYAQTVTHRKTQQNRSRQPRHATAHTCISPARAERMRSGEPAPERRNCGNSHGKTETARFSAEISWHGKQKPHSYGLNRYRTTIVNAAR